MLVSKFDARRTALSHKQKCALIDICIGSGIADPTRRELLLNGLTPDTKSKLPIYTRPWDQITSDVNILSQNHFLAGNLEAPFLIWLDNACRMSLTQEAASELRTIHSEVLKRQSSQGSGPSRRGSPITFRRTRVIPGIILLTSLGLGVLGLIASPRGDRRSQYLEGQPYTNAEPNRYSEPIVDHLEEGDAALMSVSAANDFLPQATEPPVGRPAIKTVRRKRTSMRIARTEGCIDRADTKWMSICARDPALAMLMNNRGLFVIDHKQGPEGIEASSQIGAVTLTLACSGALHPQQEWNMCKIWLEID